MASSKSADRSEAETKDDNGAGTVQKLPLFVDDRGGQTDRRRLLVVCDAPGGTLHVHFLRPLQKLREGGECAVCVLTEPHFESIDIGEFREAFASLVQDFRPDALILSRYAGRHVASIVTVASQSNLPIVGHLDDDLFDLPRSIGERPWARLMNPERLAALRAAMGQARLIIASTQSLAERLASHDLGRPVVSVTTSAGAEQREFAPLQPIGSSANVIGYMAGSTHAQDLALIAQPIANLLEGRPHLRFELFGDLAIPGELISFQKQIGVHSAQSDYPAFLDKLKSCRWDLALAPLEDTPHNRAKTPTKWVEYTIAGFPVLASDLCPYRAEAKAGAALVCPNSGWQEAILAGLDEPSRLREIVHAARDRVSTSYRLEDMGKQLLDLTRPPVGSKEGP